METSTPIRAIRKKCLDCCGHSTRAVRECTKGPTAPMPCSLFPYRLGSHPRLKRQLTPEAHAQMLQQLRIARSRKAIIKSSLSNQEDGPASEKA